MDIASGDVVWRHAMATRPRLGALTTAGGIVVSADTDRNLYFLDVTEGEVPVLGSTPLHPPRVTP